MEAKSDAETQFRSRKLPLTRKIYAFYRAPIVKFWSNTVGRLQSGGHNHVQPSIVVYQRSALGNKALARERAVRHLFLFQEELHVRGDVNGLLFVLDQHFFLFFFALSHSQVCRDYQRSPGLMLIYTQQPQAGSQESGVTTQTFISRNWTVFRPVQDCVPLILSLKLFTCVKQPASWLIYICSASFQPLALPH